MIDTHAHLMFPEFEREGSDILRRAREAGVSKIVNVGCGCEASAKSVEMADGEFLYATVGLHPYDSLDVTEDLMREWERIIVQDTSRVDEGHPRRIVAIGETGLDYFKARIDPEKQKRSFQMHLELARELDLPVIVHNRSADEDCLKLLGDFPGVKAVFHCFGSCPDFARRVWESGYMTSFTGIVTYPNADDLRRVVAEVPLDKFMTETDCPYLAPQAHRGKLNEPAYVKEIVAQIAEVKDLAFEKIDRVSSENAHNFFGL